MLPPVSQKMSSAFGGFCDEMRGGSVIKNLPAVQETEVQSLGWEESSAEGNGNPLQYSCLENPMDRGAWQATVYGVAKSQTQ